MLRFCPMPAPWPSKNSLGFNAPTPRRRIPTSSPSFPPRCQNHTKMVGNSTNGDAKGRRKSYETLETLGAGTQGSVKLARCRVSGSLCAIKSVRKRNQNIELPSSSEISSNDSSDQMSASFETVRSAVLTEARILAEMAPHKGVPGLYEVIESKSKYYIVMEYIAGAVGFDDQGMRRVDDLINSARLLEPANNPGAARSTAGRKRNIYYLIASLYIDRTACERNCAPRHQAVKHSPRLLRRRQLLECRPRRLWIILCDGNAGSEKSRLRGIRFRRDENDLRHSFLSRTGNCSGARLWLYGRSLGRWVPCVYFALWLFAFRRRSQLFGPLSTHHRR